jgi:hypothetical protein
MANEAMQGGEIGVGKEVGSHSQSPSETTPINNNAAEQNASRNYAAFCK